MMETQEPDRYEVRAKELETGQRFRFSKTRNKESFYTNKHEADVLEIIEMFRKASKTYQGG